MNRRTMLITGAAAAAAPLLPVTAEAETVVTAIGSSPGTLRALEWLQCVGALGYELRKQYAADLKARFGDNDRIVEIADLLADMNERGWPDAAS